MQLSSLTKNESVVMDVFWKEDHPITSVDLGEILKDKEWHSSYIVTVLRSLDKKEFIEVCGTVRHFTQYARQFRSLFTKEEYVASLVLREGIGLRF